MVKIGILGEIRAGKDTVTELIIEELDGKALTIAFSDGIHRVIKEHMPGLYEQGKPREALQEIGQVFRKYNSSVWIDKLFDSYSYNYAERHGLNVIVTDVRQLNEVERLKKEGFILVKVTAEPEVRRERALAAGDNFTEEMFEHETEKQVRQARAHCYIENSGTLEELRARVKSFAIAYGLSESSTVYNKDFPDGRDISD